MTASDWVFRIVGWVLLAAGFLWLLSALFRDRAGGRKRCPSCWYDMVGATGLQCPECGHIAASERRLLRTRRRWRRAALACCVLLLGYAALRTPSYLRDGPLGLIPSTYLVFFAPADDLPASLPAAASLGSFAGVVPAPPGLSNGAVWIAIGPPGSTTAVRSQSGAAVVITVPASGIAYVGPSGTILPPPRGKSLRDEVWSRLHDGRLAQWQSQIFLSRFHRQDPPTVTFPRRWLAGASIPAAVSIRGTGTNTFLGLGDAEPAFVPRIETAQRIPCPDAPGHPRAYIELRTSKRTLYRVHLSAGVELVPSSEMVLDGRTDEAAGQEVLSAMRPRLALEKGTPFLRVDDDTEEHAIPYGIAFDAIIEHDGRTLARTSGELTWGWRVWKDWEDLPLTLEPGVTPADLKVATLRLKGRADIPGTRYIERPFGKEPACWTGEVETPVVWEASPAGAQ